MTLVWKKLIYLNVHSIGQNINRIIRKHWQIWKVARFSHICTHTHIHTHARHHIVVITAHFFLSSIFIQLVAERRYFVFVTISNILFGVVASIELLFIYQCCCWFVFFSCLVSFESICKCHSYDMRFGFCFLFLNSIYTKQKRKEVWLKCVHFFIVPFHCRASRTFWCGIECLKSHYAGLSLMKLSALFFI